MCSVPHLVLAEFPPQSRPERAGIFYGCSFACHFISCIVLTNLFQINWPSARLPGTNVNSDKPYPRIRIVLLP